MIAGLQQWATALATAAAVFLALVLVRRIGVRHLTTLAARTTNRIDDLALALLQGTRRYFLAAVALWPAAGLLPLPPTVTRVLEVLAVIVTILQAAVWGNVVIAHLLEHRVQRLRQEDPAGATTLTALTVLARIGLWSALLLLALDNVGIDITALVAGLGIGGVAIALATQNILGDLFASLSIVLDKPFVVGDFIIVDTVMGTVEYVGLKTTRLRSLSGEQIIISNGDLLSSRIRNFKRMYERRIVFTIGVEYGTPADTLAAIGGWIRDIVEAQPEARFDRSHFFAFADSSLNFETVYYVKKPDYTVYMDTQQAINLAIVRKFEAEGIEFAFPTRTIHIGGGADGLAAAVAPARS
jgi:small-conductance mechanosensitive channel